MWHCQYHLDDDGASPGRRRDERPEAIGRKGWRGWLLNSRQVAADMWYRDVQVRKEVSLRLLASTDIALRVIMLLGRAPTGEQMSVGTIAERLGGLSRNHLHKIVQDLASLGVLRTTRGAGGGVAIAKPLDEVRLGWLVRRFEADQPLVECFRADGGCCRLETGCALRRSLLEAHESFYRSLDAQTLADCVKPIRRTDRRAAGGAPKSKRQLGGDKSRCPERSSGRADHAIED